MNAPDIAVQIQREVHMKDFNDIREELTELLMADETVAGITLADILEEANIRLTYDLTHIWSLPRSEQQDALDNLLADCRKAVARYVNDKMDDEVRERMRSEEVEFTYAENL